jgi:hypothetical protein
MSTIPITSFILSASRRYACDDFGIELAPILAKFIPHKINFTFNKHTIVQLRSNFRVWHGTTMVGI